MRGFKICGADKRVLTFINFANYSGPDPAGRGFSCSQIASIRLRFDTIQAALFAICTC